MEEEIAIPGDYLKIEEIATDSARYVLGLSSHQSKRSKARDHYISIKSDQSDSDTLRIKVVEKEAVFFRLAEDGLHRTMPIIMVTARGLHFFSFWTSNTFRSNCEASE